MPANLHSSAEQERESILLPMRPGVLVGLTSAPYRVLGESTVMDADVGEKWVMGMQRINIYLEEEQLRPLKHLAAEERHSVVDLVREEVDDYPAKRMTDETLWRERLEMLLARVRNRVPADVSPEEIEADIDVARTEVRQLHRAPRRH